MHKKLRHWYLFKLEAMMQTKSYYMVDEEEPILEKAEGTSIQWSSGKDPTRKVWHVSADFYKTQSPCMAHQN